MKLARLGSKGQERPAIFVEGKYFDVSGLGSDFDPVFFANDGITRLQNWLETQETLPELTGELRVGPPIARVGKIVCVGLNYALHAAESGMEAPKQPVLFFKSPTAVTGPFDQIVLPPGSVKTDWEVELALLIGKPLSHASEAEAMDSIAGYMVHNDVSEREYQLEHGGQWVKGKSCDTFAPIGPWLVTSDEIADPNNLDLWLKVNDVEVQKSNTSDFIFHVAFVLSYISRYMTLLPGDMISTGTPSGVGLGFDPPRFLQEGDVVELGIEGLGVARQSVVSYTSNII